MPLFFFLGARRDAAALAEKIAKKAAAKEG
jgi:hypothetical protein